MTKCVNVRYSETETHECLTLTINISKELLQDIRGIYGLDPVEALIEILGPELDEELKGIEKLVWK
jgi:hypothetical protein